MVPDSQMTELPGFGPHDWGRAVRPSLSPFVFYQAACCQMVEHVTS